QRTPASSFRLRRPSLLVSRRSNCADRPGCALASARVTMPSPSRSAEACAFAFVEPVTVGDGSEEMLGEGIWGDVAICPGAGRVLCVAGAPGGGGVTPVVDVPGVVEVAGAEGVVVWACNAVARTSAEKAHAVFRVKFIVCSFGK